jgi:hypothetical protein
LREAISDSDFIIFLYKFVQYIKSAEIFCDMRRVVIQWVLKKPYDLLQIEDGTRRPLNLRPFTELGLGLTGAFKLVKAGRSAGHQNRIPKGHGCFSRRRRAADRTEKAGPVAAVKNNQGHPHIFADLGNHFVLYPFK